jgi:hypothetical protein
MRFNPQACPMKKRSNDAIAKEKALAYDVRRAEWHSKHIT